VRARTLAPVLALVLAVLAAAGCGGGHQAAATKPPPKLPRALAQSLAQQADAIAASLDAGDACTAELQAVVLRTAVGQAVNAHQVPRPFLQQLLGTTNHLAGRIVCTPPPVVTKHDGNGKHDKHGNQGDGGG
jgi:stage V sporulation protein SpoVS